MQRSVLGAALASLLMIGALSGCATQTKALVSGNAAASASGNNSGTASASTSSQTASQTNTTAATGGGTSGSAGSSTQAKISVTAKGASPNISSTQKTKAQATVNQMVKIVNQLH